MYVHLQFCAFVFVCVYKRQKDERFGAMKGDVM